MLRHLFVTLVLLCIVSVAYAQMPARSHPGEIYHKLEKLNFLGSALYVAAHPDDENQRIISYLSNEVKARTAYLSLTRGDGGQNLVGSEIRELLGVIRTQELLAARRKDGGTQLFSRANDFGYSKTADETLEIWESDEVLADVVWAVRKWQPDVIINRFFHEDAPRRTHGHHTSSAVLSVDAFDKAADPKMFPEQLQYVDAWQPRRLFFNTSWWFYGSREKFNETDKSKMMSIDVGVYYPMLGESNTEIAARARSQHKSQGFGDMGTRGAQQEYLQLVKGDMPDAKKSLFEGINTTWSRVKGGDAIGKFVTEAIRDFDFRYPAGTVYELLKIHNLITALPKDEYWRNVKLKEVEDLIADCMGLYLEVSADKQYTSPGSTVELEFEAINRADPPISLRGSSGMRTDYQVSVTGIRIAQVDYDTSFLLPLFQNTANKMNRRVKIPNDAAFSSPYWLTYKGSLGMYAVPDQQMRGLPEAPRPLTAEITVEVQGQELTYRRPVVYKYEDPVKGEVYEPFEVLPPVFVSFEQTNHILTNAAPYELKVEVKSATDDLDGVVSIQHPPNWKVEPTRQKIVIDKAGQVETATFKVVPPSGQDKASFQAVVEAGGVTYTDALKTVSYDYIPKQSVLIPATAQLAKLDIKTGGERVAYIMGAGDEVPTGLRQIGYEVDLLEDEDIRSEKLAEYGAVLMGIRAYNTRNRIGLQQAELLKYVENGGTLIIQYNTAHRLKLPMSELGPYPLKLSRLRVTEEEAEVRLLAPSHTAMTTPNRITKADFEGWVQERGLYFPEEWDERYTPLLSSHDVNEDWLDGGLLVAEYGKGHYVYSGYSWFRQLPAGVPGAFRLLANLIAL